MIFGTHKKTSEQIAIALRCGYKIIDTATAYANEKEIREAIERTGIVPIIITKFNPDDFKQDISNVAKEHIKKLGHTPDIILLHSPMLSNDANIEAFNKLNEIFTGAIGVSNFDINRIQHLIENNCKPCMVELEFNPYYQPTKLIEFCLKNSIEITGYRPLGKGSLCSDKIIENIAKNYGLSIPNMICLWMKSKNITPIISSTKANNIANNLQLPNIAISDEDIIKLDNLNKGKMGSTCMIKYCNHDE